MTRTRKPISQIENSFFVRVYRGELVIPRSFAFKKHGSRAAAKRAAQTWHKIAEERLPKIPPMPKLKQARMKVRKDSRRKNQFYFDVYLPSLKGDSWRTRKFYFKTKEKEAEQRSIVTSLVTNQNYLLKQAYEKAMAKWTAQYNKTMNEILAMQEEIKTMPINIEQT